jgi:hypothetical protein
VAFDAVGDVDEAQLGVHEGFQPAVEVGDHDLAGASRAAGTLDRRRIHRDELDAGVTRGGEGRHLPVVLGPLVRGEEPATVRRVLAPDGALLLPQRGRRRRQDDASDAGPCRCPHDRFGPPHVDVEEGHGIGRAQRVDAGDVVDEVAAAHPGAERVLVERVAHGHLRTTVAKLVRGVLRAREGGHGAPVGHQPVEQRPADEPAAAGEEAATHRFRDEDAGGSASEDEKCMR